VQPIYKSGKTLIDYPDSTLIEIALCSPQIPQNTGSIARLCAAFNVILHVVEPMGFQITEKGIRRAGLDYWKYVNLYLHENWESFIEVQTNKRFVFIETGTKNDPYEFQFLPGDVLIFGAETFGIPKDILQRAPKENILTIPMTQKGVRSINLANTVSIIAYLALSQTSRIS